MRLRNVFILGCFWLASACAAEPGGTISGSVRLNGPVPNIPLVYPEEDLQACGSEAKPMQSLLLGASQSVEDVVIYLGGAVPGGNRLPDDAPPVVLDQRNCEFVPRIQIARSGAKLVLRNSDPVLHVVRLSSMSGTNGPATILTVAAPYAGFERDWKLADWREPMLLKATCVNGHDWMTGYIAVLPHPWATVTDEDGRFSIRGVPPGTYKLYAWHEALGTLTRDIRVSADRTATVNLEFSTVPSRPDRGAPVSSAAAR
jgi:hypothetical protein